MKETMAIKNQHVNDVSGMEWIWRDGRKPITLNILNDLKAPDIQHLITYEVNEVLHMWHSM